VSALRSEGWSVSPSFTPHAPTSPVTLLFDDAGFTQLAGDPAVAWQVPWSEVSGLRLARLRRGAVVVMVIAGTTYQWRRASALGRDEADALTAVVSGHGGRAAPRLRRVAPLAVAGAVVLASFGGYVASRPAAPISNPVVRALEALNLSASDVSSTWASSTSVNSSPLQLLMTPPGQVLSSSSATAAAAGSPYALAAFHFDTCLAVSNAEDRIFGESGQSALYQVSSPVFSTASEGGLQVESSAQYYSSSASVAADVAEMSRPDFGRCFAQAMADLLVGASGSTTPDLRGATLSLHHYAQGWLRAGETALSLPLAGVAHATLVVVIEAADHYEVTLMALADTPGASRATVANLANAILVRVTSTPASAA